MKKLTMSLVVASILGSSLYAAEVAPKSLEDAFSKGKVSGEIGAYTYSENNKGGNADVGYSLGSVSLGYETATFNGFKANVGFMASTKLNEKEASDYDNSLNGNPVAKSIMNIANVSYTTDAFSVIAGKQAIDLEWISDYHEAVVGVVSAIPNTTIIIGHTERFNTSANDAALEEFHVSGTEKGANVLDVTYSLNETTKFGAYYMDAADAFSAVGAKVEAEVSGLGIVGKYAKTSEDSTAPDGSIMALDLSYKVGEIALNGGYIKTGSNGAGSIAAIGDNINPFDSGNYVYGGSSTDEFDVTSRIKDTSTIYVGASTTVAGFELGALYGTTKYTNVEDISFADSTKDKESELNLTASWECKLLKNMKVSALYANISADSSDDDSSYYSLQLAYSF